ncbi:MAG: hypothetical protein V3V08_10640 [Nannocystaceae bacterium]
MMLIACDSGGDGDDCDSAVGSSAASATGGPSDSMPSGPSTAPPATGSLPPEGPSSPDSSGAASILGCFDKDLMMEEWPSRRWSFLQLKSTLTSAPAAPNLRILLALYIGDSEVIGEQDAWEVAGFAYDRWRLTDEAPWFARFESACVTFADSVTFTYRHGALHNTDDTAEIVVGDTTYTLNMNFLPDDGSEMLASIRAIRSGVPLWEDLDIRDVTCRVEPPLDLNSGC